MSSDPQQQTTRRSSAWQAGLSRLLGAVFGFIGLILSAGGLWLIMLGGTFYYLVAGVGLLATAVFYFRRSMLAVWLYLLTYAFTLVWALWEVGFDGWAQVPRLVAPSVLLVLVLASIPILKRGSSSRSAQSRPAMAGASVAVVALAVAGFAGYASFSPQVTAQSAGSQTENAETTQAPAVASQPAEEPQPGEDIGDSLDQGRVASAARAKPEETLEAGTDWPVYGGGVQAVRYSPLSDITADNVDQLKRVWTFHTGDLPNKETKGKYSPETTPVKVGDSVYLCSATNKIIALDAGTGLERWRYDPGVPADAIPYGATCRGVSYYKVPDADPDAPCSARIIEGTLDARLIAVDAETGQPCSDFGRAGMVDMHDGIGDVVPGWYGHVAVPTIVRGVVVVGAQVLDGQAEDAPSGVIRGYDARTGELAWAWDMCKPGLTGEPAAGETYTRGTPNMWTAAAADQELGYVYVPLGNSAVDYFGGNRSACENDYSSSLVALDARTGEEVWTFQTVHYDVWDYDLGSQPTLVDLSIDGETVPSVILPSKQGEIFVLDRRTGEPVFDVAEREVPGGGVEPENLSETQPFSGFHTLAKDRLKPEDMWGMSPIDQMFCRIQFHQAVYDGEYTPPTLDKRWIQYPGYNGGSDWGSVAVDPERGLLIANYNDMPNYNRLLSREEARERGLVPINIPGQSHNNPQAGSPYAIDVNAGWRQDFTGLMCKQPPYGGIRAIDLATGETVWDRPLGEARANGPFGIPSMLPIPIGTPNNGGSVVTAGGLIFIAAATDNLIRAIDIETGEVVWTDELPAGGQANPITYEADGRQYLVLMPGGHHFMETGVSDAVVAWALPGDENA